jgi:hypothetical protein
MSLKQELEKKKTSSQKIIWIAGGIGAVVIVYGLFSYFSTEEEIAVVAEPTEYTVKK